MNTSQYPENLATSEVIYSNSECVFTCSECNASFKKISSLRSHCRIHVEGKPYQCVICGRCFTQNSNLKKHLSSHKVWPQGSKKTLRVDNCNFEGGYVCSFCNISYKTFNELRSHLKTHNTDKVYKCIQNNCIETFLNLESLLEHINCHTAVEYHCDSCTQSFSTLEEIAQHFQTLKGICSNPIKKSLFECSYCGAKFKKIISLSRHLSDTDHSYKCSSCPSTFQSERSLRRHLMIHGDKKDHQCEKCGAYFRTKPNLSLHKLKHGSSNFTCLICNASFKRKDILNRHKKIHQSNKKIPCPFNLKGCQMEFTRNDKLKLHVKTHLNKLNTSDKNKLNQCASTMEIIIVPIN